MSRNPHVPTSETRAEVVSLKSFGITHDEIAGYLGIDEKTLVKYYKEELNKSLIRANAAVARVLYEKAVKERETAAVLFWLKTRAGWREMDKLGAQLIDTVNELAKTMNIAKE